MPLVKLSGVRKRYRLGDTYIEALRGVDLTIDAGEFIAVWGPSGSGKSTLCNLLGLVDECDEGVVRFRDKVVGDLDDNHRSDLRIREIGFVFQSFNLVPVLGALENVMLPRLIRGDSPARVRREAVELLETLGIGAYLDHRPDKLSGGQQQRVAIARALNTDPSLVIADEPTANLDTVNAKAIIDIMRRRNRDHGTTFVFSTHDQRLLDNVGRRVKLHDGTIAEDDVQ